MTTLIPLSPLGVFVPTYRQKINKHTVQLSMKKKDENQPYRSLNLTKLMSSMITDLIIEEDPTPSDTIRQFYKCMNERNLKQLENYISNDCFFEDYSFPNPFKGKKEVLRFLEQLITGMGENIEFHVAHIYEDDDDLIAGVNWHLEWKNRQVPFTRGCSLYRLTREGERLKIRKAQVFVESPIKPGDLFLILLKTVTSLFDAFPEATECIKVLSESTFHSASIAEDLLYIYSSIHKPDNFFLCEYWETDCAVCEHSVKDIRILLEIIYNRRKVEHLSDQGEMAIMSVIN